MNKIIVSSLVLLPLFAFMAPSLAQFRPDRPTFFEDGQLYMEKEIRRIQDQVNKPAQNQDDVEHPSQLLTIDDGKLKWQKYISRDGGFSIWIPQAIQSEETVILNTKKGDIEFEVLATHPQSLRFISAYSKGNNLSKLGDTQTILNLVKDGLIIKTNFDLIKEEPITYQSYIGKSLTMKKDQEIINFHVYFINNKIYVLAVNRKTDAYSEEITSFFDSFRILK
jgi:hypothetical protein